MKYSELRPGDKIIDYTTFGGRSYTSVIKRNNFRKQFQFSIQAPYYAYAYEYECDGVIYVSEMPKGTISRDRHEVLRNGIKIKL